MPFTHPHDSYISLNHGSFGVIPRPVRTFQHAWQLRVESNPDLFYKFEIMQELDNALTHIAPLVGVQVSDLVFVHNASFGVNSALRSLRAVLKKQGKPVTSAEWGVNKRKRKIIQLSTVCFCYLSAILYPKLPQS
jgi:selenocysteine lyase/cysteine desulfurase